MSRQQEEQEQNEKVKDTAAEGKPKAAGAADGKSGTASGPECPSGTADRSAGAQGAAGKEEREVREEDAKAESAVVEDEDDEDEEMEPKQKLRQILISAALLLAAYLIDRNMPGLAMWQRLLLYLVPYFAAGFDVLKEAGESIGHGEVFNEDFLMSIATIGALVIGFVPGGSPQFPEAVFVMLFFQVGELFEGPAPRHPAGFCECGTGRRGGGRRTR